MIWKPQKVRSEEIEQAYRYIQERHDIYLKNGHDRRRAVEFVVDYVRESGKPVLDLGTGQGFSTVELAGRGQRVATVDISEENLRKSYLYAASRSVENMIEFHLADVEKLPFGDNDFDSILMMNMLHHLKDFKRAASEIARVTAPGGTLVIADFTEKGFDILEGVLESEGRSHDRDNGMMLPDTREILWEYGLQCRQQDIRFEEHLMVAEKV
jgi:ubiquinone/menaquinone biosynthesis C-methylase UbiE